MKKSILLWKLAKIATVSSIVFGTAYFSLKNRVEEEHGPGSWDHWLRSAPEVESYTTEAKDDLSPRNLKARFWTGVPRTTDTSVVRIDRNGHSLGISKETGRTAWLATYIPDKEAMKNQVSVLRKWEPEKYATLAQRTRHSPSQGEAWAHFIPPQMMKDYYGNDADVWMTGNRFAVPETSAIKAWTKCMRLVDKYARLHSGLVVFIVPIYEPTRLEPLEIAVVLIRPSEKGPVVMCSTFGVAPGSDSSAPPWKLSDLTELEKKTGVFFFADLPPEWRNFLLHPSQNKEWSGAE